MRSLVAATVIGLLVVGCASSNKSTQPTTTPTVSETRTGLVIAVRPQEIQVFSPDATGDKTIWVQREQTTTLTRNGQQIGWDQLSEGTPVRVSFEPAAGAEKAMKIEVLTGADADQVRSNLGQMQQEGQQQGQQQPGAGGSGMDGTDEGQDSDSGSFNQ